MSTAERAWRDRINREALLWTVSLALLCALGLAIAFLPLKWAVAGVLGGIVCLVIVLRPMCGAYLLAFAIPFGALREVNVGGLNIGAVEGLIALIAVGWLAKMISQREIRLLSSPILIPLLLFMAALLFSLLVATALPPALKEISKWLEFLVIYLFLVSNGRGNSARVLIFCLLVAGSAEALLGIYQFLRGVGPEGFILFGRFMRAYGTFGQPNPYAGYLGLSLPLAFGLLLTNWRELWEGIRRRRWQQTLLLAVAATSLALMGIALVMSWSRGGWLGASAAVAFMLLISNRWGRMLFLAIAIALALSLAAGGLGLLPPAILQRVTDALPYVAGIDLRTVEVNDANWALIERMAHWQAGWQMFSASPWRGVGIGNYATVYPLYALPRWRDPLGHAHNYHLNIAAETGLIGLSAYLIFWLACFAYTLRVLSRVQGGVARGMAVAALGILTHLTVHNTFDNLFVQGMTVQIAIVLALLHLADHGKLESVKESHAHRH
jgi:putative inorganic carbon (HCO3(-)) transporter